MQLTGAMYDANPGLRSMGTAEITEAVSLVGAAFAAETGLPQGHPLMTVIGAAIGGDLSQCLFASLHSPEQPERHDDFIRMLRRLLWSGH
ncbi:hypothetical protein [Streptomyces sp. NPDC059743]|uniref:hypothetical protein n=1 Tax=Streptomyces sp. NPDC059743 TaxID=3346928 RepID=UPI0036529BE0